MNYDENIKKAEALIAQLEASEAMSMEEYKRLAGDATALLKQCKAELEGQGFGKVSDTLL